MYGYFKRQTRFIAHDITYLRKGKLKIKTKSLLITGQNNAIGTNGQSKIDAVDDG